MHKHIGIPTNWRCEVSVVLHVKSEMVDSRVLFFLAVTLSGILSNIHLAQHNVPDTAFNVLEALCSSYQVVHCRERGKIILVAILDSHKCPLNVLGSKHEVRLVWERRLGNESVQCATVLKNSFHESGLIWRLVATLHSLVSKLVMQCDCCQLISLEHKFLNELMGFVVFRTIYTNWISTLIQFKVQIRGAQRDSARVSSALLEVLSNLIHDMNVIHNALLSVRS
mmetsp:Transcript_9564/g.35450  ORF Transcript_9564/g.35450 Transcript_9564/m.35450 type:complete len:225 (-) Transcript_9564:4000-4674(-)